MNIPEFTAIKKTGRKISMLTAYDFPTAGLVDAAGIDGILVGDSLGMVVQGRQNTLPVTLEQMIYHTEIVARAAKNAIVIADLPFPGGHQHWTRTLEDCAKVLKETGCHGVKIESSAEQAPVIERLTNAGIPVLAHIGLLPQRIQQFGKYTLQRQKETLMNDAHAVQSAGAFAVVLECVQHDLAGEISESLEIPTIGIGSGPQCDGQILVLHDILGMSGYVPKHAKQYVQLAGLISQAVADYKADVEKNIFPAK